MLAADMKLAEGILCHAGGLQDHLVEGGVLAAGWLSMSCEVMM